MWGLAYVGAALVGLWGVSHAIPTPKVAAAFGPISRDNRRVLIQEWLVEAFTMWGIAAVVIVVTAVDSQSTTTAWVYRLAAGLLVAIGVLTALTGARTSVIWFKICPVVMATSAALLLIASAT